jgi:hypothetical protein
MGAALGARSTAAKRSTSTSMRLLVKMKNPDMGSLLRDDYGILFKRKQDGADEDLGRPAVQTNSQQRS